MDGLTNTMKFLMFAVFAAALLGCAPAWAHRTSTGKRRAGSFSGRAPNDDRLAGRFVRTHMAM